MRLIHEDVGDTYETIVSHIKTEFAGKKLDIYGVTNEGKPKNCVSIEGYSPAQAVKDVAAAVRL